MNSNRKDLEQKLGRVPRGVTRIWIGDEPWHIRTGDTAMACYQPFTTETFGLQIGDLDLSNEVAVKKAILKKATELRRLKLQNQQPKEVTDTQLFAT